MARGRHPVNDWTVSSLRGNLVVNSVTGFGNFDNVDVAFDSVKFDYRLREHKLLATKKKSYAKDSVVLYMKKRFCGKLSLFKTIKTCRIIREILYYYILYIV